jgi:hypothetical protein
MLTRFVESLLPGLRDARTPLASGLLWLLFAWIILAPFIPLRVDATGFVKQFYDVTAEVGSGYAIAGVGLLAYVLGILGGTAGDIVRNHVAWWWRRGTAVSNWLNWQRSARRRRRTLNDQLRTALAKATAAAGTPPETQLKRQADGHSAELSQIDAATVLLGAWIKRTPQVQNVVGRSGGSTKRDLYSVARKALYDAWEKGVDGELQRRGLDVQLHNFDDDSLQGYERLVDHELGSEPLDALRALDERLYQAFDRERAEREFRIAVMPPTIAIALHMAVTSTPWSYVVVGFASLTFVLTAIRHSEEAARVLNQLVLKALALPSLVAAERGGRLAVRDYLAQQKRPASAADASAILAAHDPDSQR